MFSPCGVPLNRADVLSRQNPHPPAVKVPNVHLDILMGRDETLECADFMMKGTPLLHIRSDAQLTVCQHRI